MGAGRYPSLMAVLSDLEICQTTHTQNVTISRWCNLRQFLNFNHFKINPNPWTFQLGCLVFEKPNGYFRTLFVEQLEQLQIWTFIQNQHGNTKTQLLFGVLPFVKNYPEQRSTGLIFQVQLEFDFRGSIFLDLETKISVLEACPVFTSQDLNQQSLNLLTVAAVGGQMVMALQTLGSVRCPFKKRAGKPQKWHPDVW